MDTQEHTELGNALSYNKIGDNPYLRVDEKGTLYLRLQRFSDNKIPQAMDLEFAAGEVIAMAGDYFTDANWTMELNLPSYHSFKSARYEKDVLSIAALSNFLINEEITETEEQALIKAYNNLAAPDVNRATIDKIYKISNSTYIPYFSSLNQYVQQLMFYFQVKNYGEMLYRNKTHFAPWSVRIYILGHQIALNYARLSYELKQLMEDKSYQSDNKDMQAVMESLHEQENGFSSENLQDLVHRYHAQALSIELFTFHYYSDHFAAGHMSMVGDLRILLPEAFGTWGSILANDIHNELNQFGVYTNYPYNPDLDKDAPPIFSRGDNDFDSGANYFNKTACIAGMQNSLQDLTNVLAGATLPTQDQYAGLKHMPDVDYNYRQYQPLLILTDDNKVYYRSQLSKVSLLSPSDYDALRASPQEYGYTELTSKWDAFLLVFKLRVLPFIYSPKIQEPSIEELARIEKDEKQRNPERRPTPTVPNSVSPEPVVLTDWHRPVSASTLRQSREQYGLLSSSPPVVEDSQPTLTEEGCLGLITYVD